MPRILVAVKYASAPPATAPITMPVNMAHLNVPANQRTGRSNKLYTSCVYTPHVWPSVSTTFLFIFIALAVFTGRRGVPGALPFMIACLFICRLGDERGIAAMR